MALDGDKTAQQMVMSETANHRQTALILIEICVGCDAMIKFVEDWTPC